MRNMVAITLAIIVSASCGGNSVTGPTQTTTPTIPETQLKCVSTTTSVSEGESASFRAQGGNGIYAWVAPPDAVPPIGDTINDGIFKTVFRTSGVWSVAVKSVGLEASCSITVNPKSVIVPPSVGTGAFSTEWRTMNDGGGNTTPVEGRFVSFSRAPGSRVKTGNPPLLQPGGNECGVGVNCSTCQAYPDYCWDGVWEFRIQPSMTLTNSPMTSQVTVMVVWGNRSSVLTTGATIQTGQTVTVTGHGYFDPNPETITLAAWWGPLTVSRTQWSEAVCPSQDILSGWTANGPPCTMRISYPTGFTVIP